jgi:3-hydroxypropanoate dehydrogenase
MPGVESYFFSYKDARLRASLSWALLGVLSTATEEIAGKKPMTDAKAAAEASFAAMKAKTARMIEDDMDLLFHEARTCNAWLDRKVPDALLKRIIDLSLLPPTSANMSPARYVFVSSDAGKARLKPCLASGNLEKTMSAPTTLIIGYDPEFWRQMDKHFPYGDMKTMFEKSAEMAEQASFRNGSMMGGYMILGARALGLDCGPMSGFDNGKIDAEFFGGTSIKSNFICNIGYGDPASVRPRGYKFAFDEIASIV